MRNFYLGIEDVAKNLTIRNYLKEYANTVRVYTKVESIKEIYNGIDIYILDMNTYLRYEKELSTHPNIKIIIIDDDITSLNYSDNIYIIHPSVSKPQFLFLIQRLCNRIKREHIYVSLPNKGDRKIAINEFEYAEIVKRSVCYNLINGKSITSKCIRTSFETEVKDYLVYDELYLIKPSFLVNLSNIKELYPGHIVFESGSVLYVPKTAYKPLKQKWKNFYFEA